MLRGETNKKISTLSCFYQKVIYLNDSAVWCLARRVFVTGCGFHIPRPSLPCILLDIRVTEIPLDVDKGKTVLEASSQPGINLYPAH